MRNIIYEKPFCWKWYCWFKTLQRVRFFPAQIGFVRITYKKSLFLLATNLFEFGLMNRRKIPLNVCIRRKWEKGGRTWVWSGRSCAVRECLVIWCIFLLHIPNYLVPKIWLFIIIWQTEMWKSLLFIPQ